MFKQTFVLVLLIAFALQAFNGTMLLFDYAANTKQYIKSCVNKGRPQMHCEGKCILMKKIQQQENEDKQHPDRKLENKNEITQFFISITDEFVFAPSSTRSTLIGWLGGKEIKMPRSVFHPPNA